VLLTQPQAPVDDPNVRLVAVTFVIFIGPEGQQPATYYVVLSVIQVCSIFERLRAELL